MKYFEEKLSRRPTELEAEFADSEKLEQDVKANMLSLGTL